MKIKLSILFIILIIIAACGKSKSPTGGPKDLINPKIISISPNEFNDLSNNKTIEIIFSKPMNRASVLTNLYFYPPIYKKKFSWDKNILTIHINEELEINKNYFLTLNNEIHGEHGNTLDKQYIFTFKNGKLNESTIYGKISNEIEEDKIYPTFISLFTADTILVFKQVIEKPDYLFETQNPNDYFIEAFTDKNKNKKFDDDEPYFKKFFSLENSIEVPIELVYQDSTKPKMKKIKTLSNRELHAIFSEPIKEIQRLEITSDDSLKQPLRINKYLIENDRIDIITDIQDSLQYNLFVYGTKDLKENIADSLVLKFNSEVERDSIPPELLSSYPATGTIIKTQEPIIKLRFNEIIFKDNFFAKLKNAEKNRDIPFNILKIDDKEVLLKPKEELENYNSYELIIDMNTSDISKNYLKENIIIKFIVIYNNATN